MRAVKSKILFSILLAGILPIFIFLFVNLILGDKVIIHENFHEYLEIVGTSILFGVAVLLLLRMNYSDPALHFMWVIPGLLSMGILNSAHAVLHSTAAWEWLQDIATFLAGILFAMVWIKPPTILLKRKYLSILFILLIDILIILVIAFNFQAFQEPKLSEDHNFFSDAFNLIGGLGFIISSFFFFLRYKVNQQIEEIAYGGLTLLLGITGLMYSYTKIWSEDWWIIHGLRMMAFIIILSIAFQYITLLFKFVWDQLSELKINNLTLQKENIKRLQTEQDLKKNNEKVEKLVKERNAELAKSNERFKLLSGLASELLASQKPQKIIENLCVKVLDYAQFDVFINFLTDSESGNLILSAYQGITEEEAALIRQSGESIAADVFLTGKNINVEDIQNSEDLRLNLIKTLGLKAYCCYPLKTVYKIHGMLCFGMRNRNHFNKDEIDLLNTVINQITIALERMYYVEEIQKAALQWQITFDSIPDLVSIQDKDFRLINVNKAYENAFGLTLSELRDRKCFEVFHNSNCKIKNCPHERTLNYNKTVTDEVIDFNSGNYFEITTSPLYNTNNELFGVVHVAKDISDRKKIQKALFESEKNYRNLVERAPDALIACRKNKIIFVNPAAMELFGAKNEQDILERSLSNIITTEFYPAINEYILSLNGNNVSTVEAKILRLDGVLRDCEISAVRYEDSKGSAIQIMFHDITERKFTEKKLQESEARFRILTEAIPQIVWRADKSGKVDFYNQHAYEYSGIPKGFTDQRDWTAFIHPYDLKETINQWEQAIKSEKLFRIEHRLRRADGVYRWHITKGVPVADSSGKISYWIGAAADIHEQKTIEETLNKRVEEQMHEIMKLNEDLERRVQQRTAELRIANQELEAFSYSVSHDLRTPLTSIDGFARILFRDLYDKLNDEYKNYLNVIINSSARMSDLIKGLLNLSRISRAAINPDKIRLDLIAAEIINRLIKSEPSRKTNIVIEPEIYINADPVLLVIIMENLINNAWKFTRFSNETKICIGAKSFNGDIIYYVQDNGSGFDMKESEKLFSPFQRLHDPKIFEGIGIGLATVKRIINKHGGKIWAESIQETGTSFYFTIP